MKSLQVNLESANELWYELFLRKGKGWLPVLTGSMAPLIHPGNQVLVGSVPGDEISFGDIIVFKRNESLYVHRVINKRRTPSGLRFVEKGDATYYYGLVNANQVIGRVTAVRGRQRTFDLASPISKFTTVILTAWFCVNTLVITPLAFSKRRKFRRPGHFLRRLSLRCSGILVRICSVVWYLSALLSAPRKRERLLC
jgi:signal peptidase I